MRTLKNVHKALSEPIGDLITYRAIPTSSIEYIDPFLFLNHHGPQEYPMNNNGLPFGPHPHRGMQTVTFILDGDIAHYDNGGNESIIEAGGIQWMSAGKGLIHSENSSDSFKANGGKLEILQLWVNLPAKLKMSEPHYKGLQKDSIPSIKLDDGKAEFKLITGDFEGHEGPIKSNMNIVLGTIKLNKGADISLNAPEENNIFYYVVKGKIITNNETINEKELAEFEKEGTKINCKAETDSFLLYGHATPLNEPVVFQGPFVMNTQAEIMQAYEDYRNGKFGRHK